MTNWRLTIASIVAVALVGAGIGIWLSASGGKSQSANTFAPKFALVNEAGAPVDQTMLKGKWTAVFFGYTYCPDFCPLTLQTLAETQKLMGPKAKDMQIVFISIDPARDTPAAIKAYLSSGGMPTGVHGLTGTEPQVAAAAKAFGATYEKVGTGDTYTMNHTAYVFLMDPRGQFELPLAYGLSPKQSADMITEAMSEKR